MGYLIKILFGAPAQESLSENSAEAKDHLTRSELVAQFDRHFTRVRVTQDPR